MFHASRKKMMIIGTLAVTVIGGGSVGLASALDAADDPCDAVQGPGCEIPIGERDPGLIDLQRSVVEQEKELEARVTDKSNWDQPVEGNVEDVYSGDIFVPDGSPEGFATDSAWADIVGSDAVIVYGGDRDEDFTDGRTTYGAVMVYRYTTPQSQEVRKQYMVTAPDRSGELTVVAADGAVLTLRGTSGRQYRYDAADEASKLEPIAP